MIIKEFRIPLPLSVDEYKIGQLYSVADASINETGGNEGIEVVVNEPQEGGQYTHKIFHLESKVPKFINALAPTGALKIDEKALNAYPYCKTEYDQPEYMKENFRITIISFHRPLERNAKGEVVFDDAVFNKAMVREVFKNDETLAAKAEGLFDNKEEKEIDVIDIANDPVSSSDYNAEEDPKLFMSKKTGRGKLTGAWYNDPNQEPLMCCYKLYVIHFKWWGLQSVVESSIRNAVRRILHNFHRQVFCWIDKWHGMTIEDIRAYEEKTKIDLDEQRRTGEARGMKVEKAEK